MAGRGKRFKFHGAFGSKARAKAKEKRVHGFIRKTKIHGDTRYIVMTKRR